VAGSNTILRVVRAAFIERDDMLYFERHAGPVTVQARDADRQLSLGLRHLQGRDPDTKDSFTMEADGRLGKLAKELQRVGITREQLVAEISSTYRKAAHPPTPEQALIELRPKDGGQGGADLAGLGQLHVVGHGEGVEPAVLVGDDGNGQ